LEAVGRLAGGIAHDFNNMLAVILGQADIASQDLPPGPSVQESIKEIRKAAQGSAELTRQLLTFARRREAAPRVLDLNQAISERLGMLQHLIGENVTLNWRPGPDLWPARMDLAQIDQILINLSVNARDAIVDAGELTISTENQILQRAGPDGPRSEWVVLTVQDTGTGMSEEIKAHLFEPFFTTKEIGKGTGMGLASVYGVVRQCGGWIDVTSELGRGTRFRIYLPRAAGMLPAAQDSVRQPLAPGGETVLVVEDMPAILKIVQLSLRSLGYTVLEAASPEEALSVLAHRTGPVQLLLTDVVMPGMNGLDLYRQVAAAHPETKVIYMSGYSDSVLPQRDAAEGDVRFLHKPFSLQELSAKIREILDKH
jgi:CheY-like chemotaxis protein